jgi:hypothetical protein
MLLIRKAPIRNAKQAIMSKSYNSIICSPICAVFIITTIIIIIIVILKMGNKYSINQT